MGEVRTPTAAERLFDSIIDSQMGRPGVSAGTGFGSNNGLRTSGKIFAMHVSRQLVVKLPHERVRLMSSGIGKPFDPRHDGRVMREWLAVSAKASRRWRALVEEAREFVSRA